MVISLALALAAVSSPSPAFEAANRAATEATNQWVNCVEGHVQRWAQVNEAVSIILDAAFSGCTRERWIAKERTAAVFSRFPRSEALDTAEAAMIGTEQGVRLRLTRFLLDQRATTARP